MNKKPMDPAEIFLANTEAIEAALGWTAEDWCEKAGLAKRNISHWRNGRGKPSLTTMAALAAAAGLEVYEVISPGLTVDAIRQRTIKHLVEGASRATSDSIAIAVNAVLYDIANKKRA